jgi:hypothetical protein
MKYDRQGLALGIVVGLAWFWWRNRPLTATVTTSETYDLSSVGIFDAKIRSMAQAIAKAEGFYNFNSIPQRANNPGDLKLGAPTLGASGITIFESVDQGWNALYRQLGLIVNGQSAHYDLGMSIKAMGDVYEADPGDNWARNVAGFLGVSLDTPLYEVLT